MSNPQIVYWVERLSNSCHTDQRTWYKDCVFEELEAAREWIALRWGCALDHGKLRICKVTSEVVE